MKWIFALSESSIVRKDHGWEQLVLTSATSALQRTSLEPYFIFDGATSRLPEVFRRLGVNIVSHRVSFYDELARYAPHDYYLSIASGAFLRTELPTLFPNDDFVLYTDVDVLFESDPRAHAYAPDYFAVAPEFSFGDYSIPNTGVMIMNLRALRKDLAAFIAFIRSNLASFPTFDQDAYRMFYAGKWDRLPATMNWKPYWGINPEAQIVHFHGPKPELAEKLLLDPHYNCAPILRELFERDPQAYAHYAAAAREAREFVTA